MDSIFIIDDDALTLLSLKASLEKNGFAVDAFASLSDLPPVWPRRKWDCIICDYFLGERLGSELLEQVRAANDDSPFIYLTSNDDLRVVIDALQTGADDYVLKPFEPKALKIMVERSIQHSRDRRVLAELQAEQMALEAEKRQIINWRLMYAAKETRQTEMMIRQLSRSINRTGGFGWMDLIETDQQSLPDGRISLSKEILDIVLDITKEQKRILDYLDFMSKIDSMPMEMTKLRTDQFFGLLLEYLQTGLLELAHKNGKELKLSLQKEIRSGHVTIEKNLFRSILWELVCNAIKYSPPDSEIRIYPIWAIVNNQPELQLIVSNDATPTSLRNEKGEILSGIPYEYCEQVFDMFYTIDAASRQITGEDWQDGTGLYIARKLMKRMGGWLKAGNGADQSQENPKIVVNLTIELALTN